MTPSAAMCVRAVLRMSCTVKCSTPSSGNRLRARFKVSGLMCWKRFLRDAVLQMNPQSSRKQVRVAAGEHAQLLEPLEYRFGEGNVDGRLGLRS